MTEADINKLRLYLIETVVPAVLEHAHKAGHLFDAAVGEPERSPQDLPRQCLEDDHDKVAQLQSVVDKYAYEFRELLSKACEVDEAPPLLWDMARIKAPSADKINMRLITQVVIRAYNMHGITHQDLYFK